MRASRLLQILLLLQNRGRLTCATLAGELEVTRRTILRDVDALTEAGLPILVVRGNHGGIELGFNYRTRLTGLSAEEAEALAIALAQPAPALDALGIRAAAARAANKLIESLPDGVRQHIADARTRFRFARPPVAEADPGLHALAAAVRERRIVYLRANTPEHRAIHPEALVHGDRGWAVIDRHDLTQPIPLESCGDINISAQRFSADGRTAKTGREHAPSRRRRNKP